MEREPLERDIERLVRLYGVSWYKFEEESGNQILDSLGNYHGTAYECMRVDGWDGKGRALSFNGNNSYIQFDDPIIPFGEKTIILRIKTTQASTGFIIGNGAATTNIGYSVYINSNGNIVFNSLRGVSGTTRFSLTTNKSVNDGQWHKIMLIDEGAMKNNGARIYIDNMIIPDAQATPSFNEVESDNNLVIGRRFVSLSGDFLHFYGHLDNVEIYNKALDYQDFFPNKTLIKSDDNIYYTLENNIWQPINENPTQKDYEQYGIHDEDLQQITKADLLALPNLTSSKPKIRTFKPR